VSVLDIKTLENWLWDAACKIRGPIDAPKYKDYILPLVFLKRLSDVFDEELDKLAEEYGDRKTAEELVEEDHSLVWFYIPKNARWAEIFRQSTRLGEYLTDALRAIVRENPKLQGVIDRRDFNETTAGKRMINDDRIKALLNVLNKHKIGLKDAEPDILGRAWEYILRKFAEGSGKSAGEFYTPKEVAILMAKIVNAEEGEEIYDPCLGSGGLIIKTALEFEQKYGKDAKVKPLAYYGQEDSPDTYAMAKMNSFIHRMEANIALGDTMNKPAFLNKDGSLKQFDIVVANPMWNQDIFAQPTYENDVFGRFGFGHPPNSSADWGWIQHMFKSLKNDGRMAVVIDTGATSRGSLNKGSNKERDLRKIFVDEDFIESVLLLPDNLFYNTTAQGTIIIINKLKKNKNKLLLINASKLFEKGKPKNLLTDTAINTIADIYNNFKEVEGLSNVVSKEEIIKNDYNLSPAKFVSDNGGEPLLPLEESIVLVKEAEEERKQFYDKMSLILEQINYNSEFPTNDYHETELGLIPRNWEIKKISIFCATQAGGTPSTTKPEFWGGDVPWINSGALKNELIKTPTKFITELGLNKSAAKLWPKNSVLIALTGATTGMVGILDFDCSANQSVVAMLPNEEYDPWFLFYYLMFSRNRVLGHKAGAAQPHINKGIVENFEVVIPPKPEQEKISTVLLAIHNAKEKNKISALEELFKSMLHDLMTAKIRVDNLEV